MSDTMKAAVIDGFGGPEQLRIEDRPRPVPNDGEVLIKVQASSINPIDFKTRDGLGVNRGWPETVFPLILGWDISGTIVESRADGFDEGNEVFGMPRFPLAADCYAEYVTAPAAEMTRKPDNVSHVDAAAVPLAALTAWQAMFVTAGLEAGQSVLIHAGAGGVGHLAIQLAKVKGAHVTTTCSAGNAAFVDQLGADVIVDYTTTDFTDVVSDMDVVFHTIPAELRPKSYATLKAGGHLVAITGPVPPEELEEYGVKAEFITVRPNGGQLGEIAQLMEGGAVKVNVEATYALDEIARAHQHVEGGHTRGKVVIDLQS